MSESVVPSVSDASLATTKQYSMQEKRALATRIENTRNRKVYMKIFKVLITHNMPFTSNDNGVFFDVTQLEDGILNKIEGIVDAFYVKKSSTIDFSDSTSSDIFH